MTSILRGAAALLAAVVLALALGACGGDDDEETAGSGGGATTTTEGGTAGGETGTLIQRDAANADKRIRVGSKNFTEQYTRGEIYAQALQAAGYDVQKELDLGAEQVAYKALTNNRVDAYPEYSGTALTSFYRVKIDDVPRDKDEAFEQLKGEAAKDDITTLPQTPFQNTFVITSTKETAEELGNPKTISELAEKAGSSKSISGFPECRQRTDCHLGLKNTYDWSPKFVSSQGKFEDLDQGQADFTFGFGTDGELALDRYVTYADDRKLFPPYHVTLMVRRDAAQRLGDAGRRVVEAVQKPLTEELMQELNSRVTLEGQEPEAVARDYLREQGFVAGG